MVVCIVSIGLRSGRTFGLLILMYRFVNYFIDKKFKQEESNRTPDRIRGRVYTPEVKEEPKKSKKKVAEEVPDFINGGRKK